MDDHGEPLATPSEHSPHPTRRRRVDNSGRAPAQYHLPLCTPSLPGHYANRPGSQSAVDEGSGGSVEIESWISRPRSYHPYRTDDSG